MRIAVSISIAIVVAFTPPLFFAARESSGPPPGFLQQNDWLLSIVGLVALTLAWLPQRFIVRAAIVVATLASVVLGLSIYFLKR